MFSLCCLGDGFNQLLEQLLDVDPYHVLRYGGDQYAGIT